MTIKLLIVLSHGVTAIQALIDFMIGRLVVRS